MDTLTCTRTATITSREIAELVEKRHDNVKRTIEMLVEQGVIESPQIEEIPTATKPGSAYRFTGERGKRDSIVVVAQLSPEFTARLVDRWQELERRAQFGFDPFNVSKAEALKLALESEEARQLAEAKVAELTPKALFHDQVVAAPDALSVGEAAKILGTGRTRLMAHLRQIGWLTRYNEPYQERIVAGLMDVKLSRYWEHPEQGLKRSVTPLITGKGMAKLRALGIGQPLKVVA